MAKFNAEMRQAAIMSPLGQYIRFANCSFSRRFCADIKFNKNLFRDIFSNTFKPFLFFSHFFQILFPHNVDG